MGLQRTKPSGLAANHGDSPEVCSPEADTVNPVCPRVCMWLVYYLREVSSLTRQ